MLRKEKFMDAKRLIELKQERATLTNSIRAILNEYEDKEIPGEKKGELDKMEKRFDEVDAIILREEAQLERERKIGEKAAEEIKDNMPSETMNLFKEYITTGSLKARDEYNALSQSNPTQAGYLVAPEQFQREIIGELAEVTFMRQKAKVLPPLQGAQSLGFPTRTAGMSSFAWGTEIQEPTADSSLAYGKREFKPIPGTSEILISKTLIRNVPNADALVRSEIAREIAENEEKAYMTGTGAGQPLGLFTASNDGIGTDRDVSTGNTATEIKFDGLIEAQEKVKGQYQSRAEWIFHRDAVKQLRKLKNTDGQYIWQPSVIYGQPELLLSKPVNRSEFAPNTFTTGQYVGIYGDLQYYWICDALTMEIQALFELKARSNQVDYITRIETDGAPVLAAAFSRVTLA
jgi:HK97 family phage major capsid protein